MDKVKILVLQGEGINCENETTYAFQRNNTLVSSVHLQSLCEKPESLQNYHIFVLPGGFSYGDEISSGQILALRISKFLGDSLKNFIQKGGLILGICNGFQALTKLEVFTSNERQFGLAQNSDGEFINEWQECEVLPSRCIWTQGLPGTLHLPIRHGEGRLVFSGSEEEQERSYQNLLHNKQIVMTYKGNPNGSYASIAALTDLSGRILGLMPHPEAACRESLNPFGDESLSKTIFDNAIQYCQKNLSGEKYV